MGLYKVPFPYKIMLFQKKLIATILSLTAILSMMVPARAAEDLSDFCNIVSENGKITVTTLEPGLYQFWVSKPNISKEDLMAVNDENDFLSKVGHYDAANFSEDGVSFEFDLTTTDFYGKYSTKIIMNNGEDVKESYYAFKYIDPNIDLYARQDFSTVLTKSDFEATVNKYIDNEYLTSENIGILGQEGVADTVGDYFIYLRNDVLPEGETFKSFNDVLECVGGALTLNKIVNNDVDSAKDLLKTYKNIISDVYLTKDENITKFSSIINGVKDEITDTESMKKVFRRVNILVELGEGTRNEIADIFESNCEFLQIDKTSLDKYGISFSDLAKYFDATNIQRLYDEKAFAEYINSIVNTIRSQSENKGGHTSGLGSGSSGGGRVVTPVATDKNTKTDDDTKQNDGNVPEENSAEKIFCDLEKYDWAAPHIYKLYEKNIINGIGENQFNPGGCITREEFVKIVVNSFNIIPDNKVDFKFNDIDTHRWSYPFVNAAYTNGIVKGADDGLFHPESYITREEAAQIIYNVAYKKTNPDSECSYSDYNTVSDYAKNAISVLAEKAIITGFEDNTIRPQKSISRAEAAVIASRVLFGEED